MWSIMGIVGQERDSDCNRPFSRSLFVKNDYKFGFCENISVLLALCEWRDGAITWNILTRTHSPSAGKCSTLITFIYFITTGLLIKNRLVSIETTSDLSTGALKKNHF